MPTAQIDRKPAPMLDVLELTVFLTVYERSKRRDARHDNHLAAQLMTEWNDSFLDVIKKPL
jgi:hypothetical protein